MSPTTEAKLEFLSINGNAFKLKVQQKPTSVGTIENTWSQGISRFFHEQRT